MFGDEDSFKNTPLDANAREFTKTDLEINQKYEFRVVATYGVDKQGSYAGPITLVAGVLPEAPTLN